MKACLSPSKASLSRPASARIASDTAYQCRRQLLLQQVHGCFQSKSAIDSIVIDLLCAVSESMSCSVPILSGLCSGTVIIWTGGPSCRSRTWLAFDGSPHSRAAPVRGLRDLPRRLAAISCGFDRDQLIPYIVQLHQPRMQRAVFKMERRRFKDIGTKFFPWLCFGEDGMAQSTRAIATFLSVANFEDQLHSIEYVRLRRVHALDARLGRLLTLTLRKPAARPPALRWRCHSHFGVPRRGAHNRLVYRIDILHAFLL